MTWISKKTSFAELCLVTAMVCLQFESRIKDLFNIILLYSCYIITCRKCIRYAGGKKCLITCQSAIYFLVKKENLMLHSIGWKIASTWNKSHWTTVICSSLEHFSMRNSATHTVHTHTELNKVHNVQCFQCFDELLYQECNVSITPFPGAVTMLPKKADNTVNVQMFSTPDEEPWSPIISLISLAPSVTLSDRVGWKNRLEKKQVEILLHAKKW